MLCGLPGRHFCFCSSSRSFAIFTAHNVTSLFIHSFDLPSLFICWFRIQDTSVSFLISGIKILPYLLALPLCFSDIMPCVSHAFWSTFFAFALESLLTGMYSPGSHQFLSILSLTIIPSYGIFSIHYYTIL